MLERAQQTQAGAVFRLHVRGAHAAHAVMMTERATDAMTGLHCRLPQRVVASSVFLQSNAGIQQVLALAAGGDRARDDRKIDRAAVGICVAKVRHDQGVRRQGRAHLSIQLADAIPAGGDLDGVGKGSGCERLGELVADIVAVAQPVVAGLLAEVAGV